MKKIVKIIIFAVAILDCILAFAFAFGFNEEKKDGFFQARQIKEQRPELIEALQTATPENLPTIIEAYQKEMRSFNDSLNDVQLQKDIHYTYLQDLKGLDKQSFEEYKSNFDQRAQGLFAKCDNKNHFIDGFKGVKDFKGLEGYVNEVEKEYDALKQEYLTKREFCKAANSLIGRADMINATASEKKKADELTALQSDLKSFQKSSVLENAFIIVGYMLGFVAIALMLFFALARIVKDFKSSYKILLVLVAFAVVLLIGYIVGSPVLSPSAIKFGMSSTGFKMVNAACFTFYVFLLCALLAIFATALVNFIKKRN